MGVSDYLKNFTYLIFKLQKYQALIRYTVSNNLDLPDCVSTSIKIYILLRLMKMYSRMLLIFVTFNTFDRRQISLWKEIEVH